MRLRRGSTAALLFGATLAACTDVSTDPQVPVSLQFDSLPALAVVVGDTMRGGDLLPARVPVRAFSGSGAAVADTQLRLIGIDTTSVRAFTVIGGLQLVGVSEAPSVRIVAQAGSLQSQTQTFAVVPRPTGIVKSSSVSDSIVYDRPDTAQRFADVGIQVLRRAAPESTTVALNGLRVRFRVVSFTTSILDSVRLVGTSSGRDASSAVMSSNAATLRVKAYTKAGATGTGVVTLEASHRALGRDVPGSPLQVTVRLKPFELAGTGRIVRDAPLAPTRALP
ncbi:MAG TPA: hypothetical protein VE861_06075 [Gemmatimonadaceae bacterium]|nr:hypothetical protein [Gemmatimonadaceae bacterium]